VFLDAVNRRRGRRAQKASLELLAMGVIVDHSPEAVIHSPAEIMAAWPTTVTRSRWPRAFVRRTQNPLSLLWKVTRSTRPARTSWVEDSGGGFAGPVTRCQAPWWSIIL